MKKFNEFINEEVGIKGLKEIVKDKKRCEIYFHKDLDGVTSAIAMKVFLKTYYGIECVDAHQIQYGGMEFAIKDHKAGNLPVLVDFAHSKPMFTIATDHHDSQIGGEDTEATYYKSARANVETISGEIAYSDVFGPTDIELIKTVDSADFLKHDLKPSDIQNAIFKLDKELGGEKNRFLMGLVTNRLLLAYKNKRITVESLDGRSQHDNKNLLECLVLDSNASLLSIFNNIRHYVNNARTSDKAGKLATPQEITENLMDYIERMRSYKFIEDEEDVVEYDPSNWKAQKLLRQGKKVQKGSNFDPKYKIFIQYGGGAMFKPGSYDRYVAFENNPEAEFFCMVWPMGLIQVSGNPFKEKKLKGVDLGKISKEVLAKHEEMLKRITIGLNDLKEELETSSDWKAMKRQEGEEYKGVGFKFSDLKAFYSDCITKNNELVDIGSENLKPQMDKLYEDMGQSDKQMLSEYRISVWELIVRNSGGHKSITNIQGFNFLKYNIPAMEVAYGVKRFQDVMKKVAREFVNTLKEKIDMVDSGGEIEYDTKSVDFQGTVSNENFDYYVVRSGKESKVTKDEFVKMGSSNAMKQKDRSNFTVDHQRKRVIAKFESFKKIA